MTVTALSALSKGCSRQHAGRVSIPSAEPKSRERVDLPEKKILEMKRDTTRRQLLYATVALGTMTAPLVRSCAPTGLWCTLPLKHFSCSQNILWHPQVGVPRNQLLNSKRKTKLACHTLLQAATLSILGRVNSLESNAQRQTLSDQSSLCHEFPCASRWPCIVFRPLMQSAQASPFDLKLPWAGFLNSKPSPVRVPRCCSLAHQSCHGHLQK